jgi:hypothetical protein
MPCVPFLFAVGAPPEEASSMNYTRYRIPVAAAPNLAPHPRRFNVHVSKIGLASLLVREFFHYRGDLGIVLSRPCMYGVFSGPVGGFSPRADHCVGCLRCTVQYPDMVRVEPNPDRLELGDSYFTPDNVDTVLYEAATGRVPVKGAGYRGRYGGPGWDGMWTDMSEIVRPTRDGIHGREFISTQVDIGERPGWLTFDEAGRLDRTPMTVIHLPLPVLFDALPEPRLAGGWEACLSEAAEVLQTLAIVPWRFLADAPALRASAVPLVEPGEVESLLAVEWRPAMIELDGWREDRFNRLRGEVPDSVVSVRLRFGEPMEGPLAAGCRTFHLVADYHGRTDEGFVLDSIRRVHQDLVDQGIREQTTLIGSGGLTAAEHVPKAIIAGLDAVALDTPLLIALQGRFVGECRSATNCRIEMPNVDRRWAVQRLVNLMGSWRDQMLEILGAMGLREVRRLRGELGRAMFQDDLEQEAFGEIEGYSHG